MNAKLSSPAPNIPPEHAHWWWQRRAYREETISRTRRLADVAEHNLTDALLGYAAKIANTIAVGPASLEEELFGNPWGDE